MSTKLVKRGLELVLEEDDKTKAKKPKRRVKKNQRTVEKGEDDKAENSKKNLQYFLGTTWSLEEDTQRKILEHQARKRKDAAVEDDGQAEEEEDWIFNFNLEDTI